MGYPSISRDVCDCFAGKSYLDYFVSQIGCIDGNLFDKMDISLGTEYLFDYPIFCIMTKNRPIRKPAVFLSAGIHGNEPAGVYALLKFLSEDVSDYHHHFDFVCMPCINPWGFVSGMRSNYSGVDINRSFGKRTYCHESLIIGHFLSTVLKKNFIFSMDLHEDDADMPVEGFDVSDNPSGFYLYESVVSPSSPIGLKITSSLEAKMYDLSKQPHIYGDKNEHGVITSCNMALSDGVADNTLEEFMIMKYTQNALTLETPTSWPFDLRVSAHVNSIISALEIYKARTKLSLADH